MKIIIEEGDKTIVLVSSDEDEEINLEEVTTINYANLYGEAVTISALLNKVGMWKADYERKAKEAKLYCDVYVSGLKKSIRREAAINNGRVTIDNETFKLTEKGLEEIVLLDEKYQELQIEQIDFEAKRDKLDSLFWAIQSKDKKLNNLLPKIVPKEFFQELIEGKINSFMIKKPKL
jgi:hypothetical protein